MEIKKLDLRSMDIVEEKWEQFKLTLGEMVDTGKEESLLGRQTSEKIWNTAREKGYLDGESRITSAFKPGQGFVFSIGEEFQDVEPQVLEVMESWRVERHIKKDEDERPLRINKQVFLDEDFKKLWDRIKLKTTYSVEYSTEVLTARAVEAPAVPATSVRIPWYRRRMVLTYLALFLAVDDIGDLRVGVLQKAHAGLLHGGRIDGLIIRERAAGSLSRS